MASCPICFNSVKSPSCCIPCGHVFCTSCIHRWINADRALLSLEELPTCPQCRTSVLSTQRVRFDTDESADDDDIITVDPWNESEVTNIINSVANLWKKSTLRRSLYMIYENLMSNDYCRIACTKCKYYGQLAVRVYQDFEAAGAGFENKIGWFWSRVPQGFHKLKNYALTHPTVGSVKDKWNNLNEDRKFMVTVVTFVCLLLVLADAQNEDGLIQSVIVPIFYTLFYSIYQMLWCLFYIIIRPVWCSVRCLFEVVLALVDILVETTIGILNILTALFVLPFTVITNLITFLITVITVALKTFVPLFILVYFLSPSVQQRCREFLAQLQNNG